MKSIWNCSLSVNGLYIPVNCLAAVNKSRLKFVQVDTRNNAKIAVRRFNRSNGEEVPAEFFGRAYELNGSLIPVSDELYDSCLPPKTDQLVFDHFVSSFNFLPFYCETFYYLTPRPDTELENFSMLHHSLATLDFIGISQTTFHNCSHLFALMPYGSCFVLMKLVYQNNIEDAPVFTHFPLSQMNPVIQDTLDSFIMANSDDFDISGYRDHFDETFLESVKSIAA